MKRVIDIAYSVEVSTGYNFKPRFCSETVIHLSGWVAAFLPAVSGGYAISYVTDY